MHPVPPMKSFRMNHMQQRSWDSLPKSQQQQQQQGRASSDSMNNRARAKYNILLLLAVLAILPMLFFLSNNDDILTYLSSSSRSSVMEKTSSSSRSQPIHHIDDHHHQLLADSVVFKTQVVDRSKLPQQPRELFWGQTLLQNNNNNDNPKKSGPVVIAYVITILECHFDEPLWDGAAVLARTILLNSVDNPFSASNYGAKMYAIIHESAVACAEMYQRVGYEIIVKPSPVKKDQLYPDVSTYFHSNVETRCNQLKDYTSLWAYTLTTHPIVVLVDVASYMIQPVDELYTAMLLSKEDGMEARKQIAFHWKQMGQPNTTLADYFIARTADFPDQIDAFFTRDYTITSPQQGRDQRTGIMEGFIVIRPNVTHFDELTNMIRQGGGWTSNQGGWYDQGIGGWTGAMCTTGLLSAFYTLFHNDSFVELNRCVFNCVADSYKTRMTATGNGLITSKVEECRDGRANCHDCRAQSLTDAKTVNMNLCRQPWTCFYLNEELKVHTLCRAIIHEWFQLRRIIEIEWERTYQKDYTPSVANGTIGTAYFMGYCSAYGSEGYIPMNLPPLPS